MKTYTVKELHEILGNAINNGKGDLVVLVPNNDEDINALYATLGRVSFDEDIYAGCAYFDQNWGKEEEAYWEAYQKEKKRTSNRPFLLWCSSGVHYYFFSNFHSCQISTTLVRTEVHRASNFYQCQT